MSFTKFASFEDSEILSVKGSPTRVYTASLDKLADFEDYRTNDGYMYCRLRAISSRVNRNHDGWPSLELAGSPEIFDHHAKQSSTGFTVEAADGNQEFGFATFMGKPNFIDHNNSDPSRARGVIVDAKLRVLPLEKMAGSDDYWTKGGADPEHMPPTEVELLIEIDAQKFPTYAKAVRSGELDGFSMGCFVAGTPITLNDGTQKYIETIEVGDEILTHKGYVKPVTATMAKRYQGDLYHIETYGEANTLHLTRDHPIWIQRQGRTMWIQAQLVREGDLVLTPKFKSIHTQEIDPAWAKLVGFYLAEGNLGHDKKRYADGRPVLVEWSFHVDEAQYIDEVKESLEAMGYRPRGPYIKHNCATIRCNSPELADRFAKVAGQHSWAKKLDVSALEWSPENQKLLLDAYFAGDGHDRNGKIEISTASENLAHQVFALSTRVGYRMTPPRKQHSPSASHKRAKYSMYATTEVEKEDHRFHLDYRGLWRKVVNVSQEPYDGLVYNFDVDGQYDNDDSYVAADIAVHNCDVEKSKCSHCGHEATNPSEYCSHILMKGAHHDFKTADGKHTSKRSYENCYGIHFFEISAVFDPADETALAREVRAGVINEGSGEITGMRTSSVHTAENPLPQSFHTTAPEEIDTLRQEQRCPICGENMEGEECSVCGYTKEPEGFGNPDLGKAQKIKDQEQQGDDATIQDPSAGGEDVGQQGQPQGPNIPQGDQQQGQSYLQQTRNTRPTAGVITDMRWQPKIDSRLAARINQFERPIKPSGKPATNEQEKQVVVKNPTKPVTATMRTAQELIEASRANKGDTMSTKTADGPTGPEASPDVRTDVTGVGGVIEDSNEAASAADGTTDVTGVGSTGVTDVGADSTESLSTAGEGSDDSGFNKDKTTDDSGPTSTYGDSDGTEKAFTDEVTNESLEGNQNKDSKVSYDSKPFYDQPGLSGGSANQGTQPVDAVGKAQDRVDVLKATTTPENNSGATKTWSGTDGNAIYRQQDPVTPESIATDGFTSHIVAAFKLADIETDLGLISKDEKYNRIAELEVQSAEEIAAQLNMLARVKTAGTAKLAQQRTAGVTRLPGSFGRRTAAPAPDYRTPQEVDGYDRVDLGDEDRRTASEAPSEDVIDSALFSR